MTRYDAIKTLQDHKICFEHDFGWNKQVLDALDIAIKTLNTDVSPVRHGHYVSEFDGYADGYPVYDMWYCSECDCYFEEWDEKPTYNYCPNCGAKMDGEEE